ncbi:hypothetical protein ABZV78_09040 [Micromonospora sp. NPDC004540]
MARAEDGYLRLGTPRQQLVFAMLAVQAGRLKRAPGRTGRIGSRP